MKKKTSQSSPPDVEKTLNVIAAGLNAGQTVIFCGAGISRDSGFPVVNEFVAYVLLTLSAEVNEIDAIEDHLKTIVDAPTRQDTLKRTLAERLEVPPEVIERIMESLPFEAFVESLRNDSVIDKIFEIYDANAYDPHVVPNANHALLARLAATGRVRTIITTNFDQLIEKALDQQHLHAGVDYDVIYREQDFERINWEEDRCRLIKIHGSIDDKPAMAITLRQVAKKELSAARASVVRQVFREGSHKQVLILGYSCSDVFDLSPQIAALADNAKLVYLVQHSDSAKTERLREQKQKNPFKEFSQGTRLFYNTSRLVETLWNVTSGPTSHGAGADHVLPKTPPDWHVKVQAWCAESMKMRTAAVKDVVLGRLFDIVSAWKAALSRYERVLALAKAQSDGSLEMLALNNMGSSVMQLGEFRKAIDLFKQCMELAPRTGDVGSVANALGNMAEAFTEIDEYDTAIKLFQQHLEVARRIGDLRGEGKDLNNIGNAHLRLGDYKKAIKFYEESLAIAREVGDKRGEAVSLGSLGSAYSHLGEFNRAFEFHKQAFELFCSIGDLQGESNSLGNMASDFTHLGEYRKAIKVLEQRLPIAFSTADVQAEANTMSQMGNAYLMLTEHGKALEYYQRSLVIYRHIGSAGAEGGALGNIGNAYRDLGEYDKAIGFYEQQLEIARRIRDVRGEGSALGGLGNTYLQLGQAGKSITFFEQSLEIDRRIGNIQGEGSALGNLGSAYLQLRDYPRAVSFFEQHIKMARQIHDPRGEANSLTNMGSAYAMMGDKQKAAQAFGQGRAIFAKLGLPNMVRMVDGIMKQLGL